MASKFYGHETDGHPLPDSLEQQLGSTFYTGRIQVAAASDLRPRTNKVLVVCTARNTVEILRSQTGARAKRP